MIQSKLYFDKVWRQWLWQKNVSKTNVEQTKGDEKSYPYLYPIGDLVQGSFHTGFHGSFYVCTNQEASLLIVN